MGKPAGFLEYPRALPPDRPPRERVRDWREFHRPASEEHLRLQAARCMDCGTPFCHSGLLLGGQVTGCPLGSLIPEWHDLAYRGHWRAAVERLLRANDFPEFTGRVCPAPCESACAVGINGDPVTTRANEFTLIEKAFAAGWIRPQPPLRRTGKKVAVIGSGPAGLACAARLNRAGHLVTVFERADRPGGLLMYGIPQMKLAKEVVRRRLDLLAEEGVVFRPGTEVGLAFPAEDLRREFDAAVLCGGAGKPRDLAVAGRELGGIHFALDYLRANTQSLFARGGEAHPAVSARGLDVIVIGGGDTGTDCVATALRQGCRSVTQLEILPRPPAQRTADNPWPQWPRIFRVDYGQEETAALHGADPRVYSVQTTRFCDDGRGRVGAVEIVRVEWGESGGRQVPTAIPGTERMLPAQLVLLALGFLGPEDRLPDLLGLERDARGNVKAEFGSFATAVPGLFAAGDMRRGQSLVAWAIHEGRGAARECDRFLMGRTWLT